MKQKQIEPKEKVLAEWKKTLFLREEKEISARGWLLDVMRCVEKVGKHEFTLADVYAFERELSVPSCILCVLKANSRGLICLRFVPS